MYKRKVMGRPLYLEKDAEDGTAGKKETGNG